MSIEISIIVPVYNTEKYIEKCIESILYQSFKNFEIIIINDGSLDNSEKVCNNLKHRDNRIKLISKKHEGLSVARNIGLQCSKGKYISFIDSDDYIESDMIDVLYHNLLKYNADISMCRMNSIYGNHSSIIPSENTNQNIMIFKENIMESYLLPKGNEKRINTGIPNKLYCKELFNNISFPPKKYFEDFFITYKLMHLSKGLVIHNGVKYNYVHRNGSISNSLESIFDLIEGINTQFNFIIHNYPHLKKQCFHKKIELLTTITESLFKSPYNTETYKLLEIIKLEIIKCKSNNCDLFNYEIIKKCEQIIKKISRYQAFYIILQHKNDI